MPIGILGCSSYCSIEQLSVIKDTIKKNKRINQFLMSGSDYLVYEFAKDNNTDISLYSFDESAASQLKKKSSKINIFSDKSRCLENFFSKSNLLYIISGEKTLSKHLSCYLGDIKKTFKNPILIILKDGTIIKA